jgi:sugar phosphate isomerase/epimerase
MNRREFVRTTALASTGLLLYSCGVREQHTTKSIGLQLYTLKDIIKDDVQGILKAVAGIGFKKLEAYSYADGKVFDTVPYAEFITMVSDLGMQVTSGHYGTGQVYPGVGTLSTGWEVAVDDAAKAKQEYMVIAWLAPDERKSLDDYKRVCELMNKQNELCRKAGIRLSYHNHDFEFAALEDQIPYDLMLKELDPSISMELDLYWINFAGFDALEYFKKHPGRFDQWHVKDRDKVETNRQTDVGSGSIDFKPIFAAAEQSGLKHFYLEQEFFVGPQLDSITKGYKYLESF